jgi:hypothetical protein
MGRKRKQVEPSAPRPNADWVYITEMQINGRNVSAGTELKITGERGRYRFIRKVTTDKGVEWIDVWGGPKGAEQWRSFREEKVRRVHYKNTTDKAMAAEYKAKKAAIKKDNSDSGES